LWLDAIFFFRKQTSMAIKAKNSKAPIELKEAA